MAEQSHSDQYTISKSQFFALSQGAVVTTPVVVDAEHYKSPMLKPGSELEFTVTGDHTATLKCTILDVESKKKETGNWVNVRITIQKS